MINKKATTQRKKAENFDESMWFQKQSSSVGFTQEFCIELITINAYNRYHIPCVEDFLFWLKLYSVIYPNTKF